MTSAVDDPWGVHGADLDRDGDLDVVTASQVDDRVAWFENDGGSPPAWTMRTISALADGAMSVAAADFDGDGDTDVLAGTWDSASVLWYENDGGSPPAFGTHLVGGCGGAESIATGRIDGDVDVDVLCAANVGRKALWWENQANYADADADGVRDGLDCAPGNAVAFAVPGEVRGLRFPGPEQLAWTTEARRAGTGASYDVVRGPLDGLPVGTGSGETCRADGTALTTHADPTTPAPGAGVYYLVRAATACGTGTYGLETPGLERTTTACP